MAVPVDDRIASARNELDKRIKKLSEIGKLAAHKNVSKDFIERAATADKMIKERLKKLEASVYEKNNSVFETNRNISIHTGSLEVFLQDIDTTLKGLQQEAEKAVPIVSKER